MPVTYPATSGGIVGAGTQLQPFLEACVTMPDAYPGSIVFSGTIQGNVPQTPPTSNSAGISTPPAPVLSSAATGGTIQDGTYYVIITYLNPSGETLGSVMGQITTSGGGKSTITVTSPPAFSNATNYRVYMTALPANSTGNLFLQNGAGTAIGTNFVLTANPSTICPQLQLTNGSGGNGLALPAVPGGGTTFWILECDPSTGYCDLVTSSSAYPVPGTNSSGYGKVQVAQGQIPTGSTIPWAPANFAPACIMSDYS